MSAGIGALLLAVLTCDLVRQLLRAGRRRPLLARLAGRRAALLADERLFARRLLRGELSGDAYRDRMELLAHGTRRPEGVRHG